MPAGLPVRTARAHHPVVRIPATRLTPLLCVASGLALSACSSSDGAGPLSPDGPRAGSLLGDPAAGRLAFVEGCAGCHASRDGFDLAAFDFTPMDVVRRGLAHVDSVTARNIAAHIESIDVAPMPRAVPPFQPGGTPTGQLHSFVTRQPDLDLEFWSDLFGTEGWPDGLTTDALLAIDPREVKVPLDMPRWSIDGSSEDWMPDRPLPSQLLDHGGGALRTALDAYYWAPSEENLIRVLGRFDEALEQMEMCSQREFFPCFDVLRWMASLGAQHYLRGDPGTRIPAEVAQLWWDVGEGAIGLITSGYDEAREAAFRIGARWLYLAFSVAPEAFREPPGNYMNTFLGRQDLRHVSLFVALRRMVAPTETRHPDQYFEDGQLAIERALDMTPGVVEFVFQHWIERLEAGPPGFDPGLMRAYLLDRRNYAAASSDGKRWPRILTLRDRLLELLV